jgi:hypothetical protein
MAQELVCLFRGSELMISIMIYLQDPKFVYLSTYVQPASLIFKKNSKTRLVQFFILAFALEQ